MTLKAGESKEEKYTKNMKKERERNHGSLYMFASFFWSPSILANRIKFSDVERKCLQNSFTSPPHSYSFFHSGNGFSSPVYELRKKERENEISSRTVEKADIV